MYHKLLVKKFVKNIGKETLKNSDGSIATEKVKAKIIKQTPEGEVEEDGFVDSPIIPTNIQESEFILYQQIDDSNGSHSLAGYVDEKGNAFEFPKKTGVHYEVEITEEDSNPIFN